MIKHSYYTQENHGPYSMFDLGDFELEEGGKLRGCQIAYSTFGTLNSSKSNAILIPTWYSGTGKIMEQVYIGPGRAIDTDRYFVVIANQIGSGLSTSPHNTPSPFNGPKFPKVRIGDDVRAQHALLTGKFGIEKLEMVCGGSMGAQQTYEWAVRFPDMVKRAAPIAGTARNTPHNYVFAEALSEAITSDPGWNNGWYGDAAEVQAGLRRHSKWWAVMGLCTELFKQEQWRSAGFSSVEDFLTGFLEAYFVPMDPNDLLCMAWKWQRGDVSRHTGGDLAAALGRIKAKVFVMPIDEDMFFPPRDCKAEQELIPNSEIRVIHSLWGHLGLFGVEPGYVVQIDQHLRELLSIPV